MRKPGWYHVKDDNGFWECAQWNGYGWNGICAVEAKDGAWLEIGPRIPTPDELWQCAPNVSTEEMDDAVRGFLMLLSGGGSVTYERLRYDIHRRGLGWLMESWPDEIKTAEGHIPKAGQSDLIWRMMLAVAPEPGEYA